MTSREIRPGSWKAWITGARRDWFIVAVTAVVVFGILAVLALMGGQQRPGFYLTGVVIVVLVFALFATGLNLQFGYTGLINFGHVAAYILGAYSVALFSQRRPACRPTDTTFPGWLDWVCTGDTHLVWIAYPGAGEWWALALAVLIGFLAAGAFVLLLGIPTLKLREDYLAIVAIGAAEILRIVLTNERWMAGGNVDNQLGGATGIPRYPKPWFDAVTTSPGWQAAAESISATPYYLMNALIALVLLAIVLTVFSILINSPWGRVLKAIREDEEVVRALGKNVFRYKMQALVLGALAGALAGAAYAWYVTPITPKHGLPIVTFYAWIIMIIGGAGNLRGPIVGSLILWGIFETARLLPAALPAAAANVPFISAFTEPAGQIMLIGILLILAMVFRPQGILGKREEMLLAK